MSDGDGQSPAHPKVKLGQPETDGDVVLVTGGAGFLGQHIVKALQEKATGVKEIRVFDVKPWKQVMDYKAEKPMRCIVGDIRSKQEVQESLQGVGTVFHTAALISFGTHPDLAGMEEVNVRGTENVISGCLEEGVSRLVFTSSVDVSIGYDEIMDGDENLPTPKDFLFPGYPATKHKSEGLVLGVNGTETKSGNKLHTVSLRPNVMYGEEDPYFIPGLYQRARRGIVQRFGDYAAKFQAAYVGNVAWGHLLTAEAMTSDPETVGGQAFLLTDDTPVENFFQLVVPFLKAQNMGVSERKLPYWLIYGLIYASETIAVLLRPLVKVELPTHVGNVLYISQTYYFNSHKAEKLLGYKPIYSYTDSIQRANEYYKTLKI